MGGTPSIFTSTIEEQPRKEQHMLTCNVAHPLDITMYSSVMKQTTLLKYSLGSRLAGGGINTEHTVPTVDWVLLGFGESIKG